jgi:hypothetical protein
VHRMIVRCGGAAARMKKPAVVMIAGHALVHALLVVLAVNGG